MVPLTLQVWDSSGGNCVLEMIWWKQSGQIVFDVKQLYAAIERRIKAIMDFSAMLIDNDPAMVIESEIRLSVVRCHCCLQ